MAIHSTTFNVSRSKQWHLSLQGSTFVKTFIKACGELRRVTNNFRTEPIHLKKSTASKRQKWGQGVQNTQYKENTGGKI
jgi:hypothetical protein